MSAGGHPERIGGTRGQAVIIGIGNRWRGDDAAGPAVIEQLAGLVDVVCIDAGDAPERHLGEAAQCSPGHIVLVDAVDFGGATGRIVSFTAEELSDRFGTTHDMSLHALMKYLEATTGAEISLLGLQPAATRFGDPMCEAVRQAVAEAARLLRERFGPTPTEGPAEGGKRY